jgi:hypothetical protein
MKAVPFSVLSISLTQSLISVRKNDLLFFPPYVFHDTNTIKCCPGDSINIIDEADLPSYPEVVRMRGYKIQRHEESSVQTECGKEGDVVFTSDDWNRLRYLFSSNSTIFKIRSM